CIQAERAGWQSVSAAAECSLVAGRWMVWPSVHTFDGVCAWPTSAALLCRVWGGWTLDGVA
ncbi:MAG: hypothetical protein FWG16_05660, partial [Micrococcales bacterium]|nr:hypothetical protein [Micrococcales bacterium]